MLSIESFSFEDIQSQLRYRFTMTGSAGPQRVDVGEWQSTDVSDRPEMVTHELQNVSIEWKGGLPQSGAELVEAVPANQPWAEQHFGERVSGTPFNPPPSHAIWPHAQANNNQFTAGGKFSHTYPERFWPQYAGYVLPSGYEEHDPTPLRGIRYRYGDLDDVVDLLCRSPLTRQAFLPVWFPEDTGAVHRERVPCTLGYHFMVRGTGLTTTYYMRSCDFRRHFADDVYLAVRLAQWVSREISKNCEVLQGSRVTPAALIMHIASLHIFEGDLTLMRSGGKDKPHHMLNYSGSASNVRQTRSTNIQDFKW